MRARALIYHASDEGSRAAAIVVRANRLGWAVVDIKGPKNVDIDPKVRIAALRDVRAAPAYRPGGYRSHQKPSLAQAFVTPVAARGGIAWPINAPPGSPPFALRRLFQQLGRLDLENSSQFADDL